MLALVAFFVATLSLWSRKATKFALCCLAIPWALAVLFGVVFLARGFLSRDSLIILIVFIANFLLFGLALWSVFRSKLNLIPLLSLGLVMNTPLLAHFFAARQRQLFEDPSPWSLSREPGWQLAILALSGLLFLWAARALYEEWSCGAIQAADQGAARKSSSPGVTFYSLNALWIAFVGYFVIAFHVFGLTPVGVRLDSAQHFQEKLIAKIPIRRWYSTLHREEYRGSSQYNVWISPDGQSVAYLLEHPGSGGSKWSVVHGDSDDPEFDRIGYLRFSPSGNHLAYAAREGKEWLVVLDGQKGVRRGFSSIGDLWWVRGGSLLVYDGYIGQSWQLVVGDQSSSPGGLLNEFVYEDGTLGQVQSNDGVATVFVDGKRVFGCARGTRLIPWWREKQFACIESHNGKEVLVFNGKTGPAVDRIGYPENPSVSRDGKQVIYGAEDGKKQFVVVGDRVIPFPPCADPAFGPDGRYAYLACEQRKEFLVVDGTPWPSFEQVDPPVFSDDGKSIACAAHQNGREFFLVDGRKGLEFDGVNYKLEFASNSERFAYIAWRANSGLVVVGDKPGPEFDAVDEPVFSPDGKMVAYRAKRRTKQFIVANDKEGPGFDWVSAPVFSSNGRQAAYVAADGRELWLKVIDLQ